MLLLIIDDISISLKKLDLYGFGIDKCNIYTFKNPIKFKNDFHKKFRKYFRNNK